jgi:hypothetical protein
MNEQAKVAAATVVVFVAGLLIGVWTQRAQPAPPPPIPVMGEFAAGAAIMGPSGGGPITIMRTRPGPRERMLAFTGPGPVPPPPFGPVASMNADQARHAFEAMVPKIRAFQDNVGTIEDQFRSSLQKILRPDQQKKLADFPESRLGAPGAFPGCIEPGPFFTTMIIYRPLLENLTMRLGLDAKQQEQVKQLLIERRNRLLALVDATPPPSLSVGKFIFREHADAGPPPLP